MAENERLLSVVVVHYDSSNRATIRERVVVDGIITTKPADDVGPVDEMINKARVRANAYRGVSVGHLFVEKRNQVLRLRRKRSPIRTQ